jgi:hypothetical protein
MKLTPKFIYDENDKKVGVLLPISQFEKLIEEIEDFRDYKTIKVLRKKGKPEFSAEAISGKK